MSDTPPLDRVRLRALAEQATTGPWTLDHEDTAVDAGPPTDIYQPDWIVMPPEDELGELETPQHQANMRFIAAARNAILLLLDAADERDRLAARVQELEQALRDYGHHGVICGSGLRSVWHEHLMEQCTCGLAAALKGSNP